MINKVEGKLCVFGCYSDNHLYPRNRTLISAVSLVFSETIEIRPQHRKSNQINHKTPATILGALATLKATISNLTSLFSQRAALAGASLYYVPYPAYLDLLFLRIITPRKDRPKVAIDAFLCLQDTIVSDRKLVRSNGVMARLLNWLEGETLKYADLIFIDTEQQKQLLVDSYRLNKDKVIVTPVGIDETIWTPLPELPIEDDFHILFWGTFIPLHGVDIIFGAANLLANKQPQIKFTLIGDGQTAEYHAKKFLSRPTSNVVWLRELVSPEKLRSYVERSHCILGIFGESKKAGNVVPYKMYQALASNKILITLKGPATAAICPQGTTAPGLIFVPPGSPSALANEILRVSKDYKNISRLQSNREIYESNLCNRLLQMCVADSIHLVR